MSEKQSPESCFYHLKLFHFDLTNVSSHFYTVLQKSFSSSSETTLLYQKWTVAVKPAAPVLRTGQNKCSASLSTLALNFWSDLNPAAFPPVRQIVSVGGKPGCLWSGLTVASLVNGPGHVSIGEFPIGDLQSGVKTAETLLQRVVLVVFHQVLGRRHKRNSNKAHL